MSEQKERRYHDAPQEKTAKKIAGRALGAEITVDEAFTDSGDPKNNYIREDDFNNEELKARAEKWLRDTIGEEIKEQADTKPQPQAPATIEQRDKTPSAFDKDQEIQEEKLSVENQEFLNDSERQEEYNRCKTVLIRENLAENMPSFKEAIAIVRNFGNEKITNLRKEAKNLKLVVAKKMSQKDFKRFENENKIWRSNFSNPIFYGGTIRDLKGFSVGLCEAFKEPDYLRDDDNPDNYIGKHYDKEQARLADLGLRNPQGDEYIGLFYMEQENEIIIDKRGITFLNVGKRKQNALVPLASEAGAKPYLGGAYPYYQAGWLRSRPSWWGDYVLKS